MTSSGQICKMSYTAYCNTYCNILQYIVAFCHIVSPLQTKIFFIQRGVIRISESHQKKETKTEEEKEDKAHARDIAMLQSVQIKTYKHFLNVILMYNFVC